MESQDVFGHLPAGLAVGAVSVSAGRGCLAAVFVLICSLCLLAAELKLVQRESWGLLSPGLFPLSAHAAAIRLQAGDTQGQGHGGGRTTVTRSWWQEHSSTPVTPIPGAFASSTNFLAPGKPSELLARGFCSQRGEGWVPVGCTASCHLRCHSLVPEGSAAMCHLATLMFCCPLGPWDTLVGVAPFRDVRSPCDYICEGWMLLVAPGGRTLVPHGMWRGRIGCGGCEQDVPIPLESSLDPSGIQQIPAKGEPVARL